MIPDIPCLCKQCRSRSVGFFRSQLIWICTVCHQVCEFIQTIQIKLSDWLNTGSGCGSLIYSAWQGLKIVIYHYLAHLLDFGATESFLTKDEPQSDNVPPDMCAWQRQISHGSNVSITKTGLYNFNPLKPHFYIVKLRFTEVGITFSYFVKKNIDCGYSLEPLCRGSPNEYPQSMFM